MLAASVKQSDGMHNLECIMGQERSGEKFERMEGRNDEDLSQRNSGRYNPKALYRIYAGACCCWLKCFLVTSCVHSVFVDFPFLLAFGSSEVNIGHYLIPPVLSVWYYIEDDILRLHESKI